MSVLDSIIQASYKRAETLSTDLLTEAALKKNTLDFAQALKRKQGKIQLIAELKRRSPSLGVLNAAISVPEAIRLYEPFAAALSILTEPEHFNGSIDDLREARRLTNLPLLRKDFIVDKKQIAEARLVGANSFLLIVAALSNAQLVDLLQYGRSLEMEPLIEVHNAEELNRALQHNIRILGVNNRNLHTLAIDLQTTPTLIAQIPIERQKELVLVAESGYSTREQLNAIPNSIDAVLIGTGFMGSEDPAKKLSALFGT